MSIEWPKGFKDGACPDCGCVTFLRGPEGADSVNFKCKGCGSTFNNVGSFGIERLSAGKQSHALRLQKIAEIIEAVDNRCMAADGPVTPTLQEMTQDEIKRIYSLAKG